MKILVSLKRVRDPDNANKVAVTPSGDGLVASALEWKINPFDEYALEAALRLTEDGRSPKQRLGEVVVVTFGPAEADSKLRAALALGADRAVRVDSEDESLDGGLVARGLAALVRAEGPDLVLMGKQAVDGDSNQVGQLLAELLDWPMATFAATIREEPRAVRVEREVDGGTVALRLGLPAVVTVDLRIVSPSSVCSLHTPPEHLYAEGVRFAPLPAVIAAKRKPLAVRALTELTGGGGLTTRYLGFATPPARAPGRLVGSVSELVELLATEAKVIWAEAAMSDCLVIAESWGGRLRKATLSAIGAARQARSILGGGFSILVLGRGAAQYAAALVGYGADRVLVCEHPALEHYVAEHYAPTVAAVARNFGLVLAAASSFGKDLVPRVAARLGAAYAADCSALRGEGEQLVFERPMYAGNVLGSCVLGTAIQAATIRQSEFPAAEPLSGDAPSLLEAVPFAPPGEAAARVEFLSFAEIKSERPELGEARAVVSGGRPLKEQFFPLLGPLAAKLGAAIGATRAACDSGYAPGDCQVGQTGKVVAPELYVAVGISGALQHVAGMRGSRVVVAINRDPEAPIFQVADYGLVADLFEAVPELTRALAEHKNQA